MAIKYKAFWRDIPLGVIGFDIFNWPGGIDEVDAVIALHPSLD